MSCFMPPSGIIFLYMLHMINTILIFVFSVFTKRLKEFGQFARQIKITFEFSNCYGQVQLGNKFFNTINIRNYFNLTRFCAKYLYPCNTL